MMTIDKLIATITAEVIAWRRHLHQNPELSFQEEKTAQFVYDQLGRLNGLELSRPTRTSVMARLIGDKPGKVLALRADMDALAIEEETGLAFASQTPGVMHACGHDGHTAMLLGTAAVLCQLRQHIKGEVRFIFQHAEELFPGGSRELIQAGALANVDMILGLHVMSHIPVGKIGIVYGPVMAASDTFEATVQGRGGHASQPHLTVDPIAIGAQAVTNLQHIVARTLDPMEQLVVSITTFHGGTSNNVIPDTVSFCGSVRSFSPAVRQQAEQRIEAVIAGISQTHGASYKLAYHHGYDPVFNDEAVTRMVEETVTEVWGKQAVAKVPPLMAGEDFSFYLQEAPGCFIFIGTGNPAKGCDFPLHHPKFNLDEDSLAIGVKLSVQAALRLLAEFPGE
ncbi:MAG: M20 family metallopeptidase [Sporomusaceae bacterium]|nr:M20 family metallopeptidase [Sporomusaceae bacterium]